MEKLKVAVVLPAYNAEMTLRKTINDIPFSLVDDIILVDDGSHDRTVEAGKKIGREHPELELVEPDAFPKSKKIGFVVYQREQNGGYGANQKTCYSLALARGAGIVIMLHPDYQYDPKLIKYFVEFIRDDYFDVMLGSRVRSRREARAGGMPLYKYIANRLLTLWQNIVSGQNLSEWHTGMRAYHRKVLEAVDFEKNSDDFVFDTQMLFKIVERGFLIGDIPVPVKYFAEASSINLNRSLTYGFATVWESLKFLGRKISGTKSR